MNYLNLLSIFIVVQSLLPLNLNKPQTDIQEARSERVLFHCGQGGGKTFNIGVLSARFVLSTPNVIGFIGANTYGQLSDSTLREVFEVWKKHFGWSDGVDYVIDKRPPAHFKDHGYTFKDNNNKIFIRNGAVIFTRSLDNYEAIEGMTIGWALLDETSSTKEEAVKEVITGRLRQKGICVNMGEGFGFVQSTHPDAGRQVNPLFVFTKPSKEQWLTDYFKLEDHYQEIEASIYSETDYFYHADEVRTIVIASSYHNADNLPPSYIETRKGELSSDKAAMIIYGSPFGKSGVEYYTDFDRIRHVGHCEFEDGLSTHLTWDFNVHPYISCQVWQIKELNGRMQLRCVREYALESPRNTIEDVCSAFIAEYGHRLGNLFYYGDATGQAKTVSKVHRSHYDTIEKELSPYLSVSSKRLLKQNPRHRSLGVGTLGRRDFMNAVFKGTYDVDVLIDPSCKYTNADFMYVKENAQGGKEKKKVEINGVRCEKYGHMSDATDGMFCYLFGDYKRA